MARKLAESDSSPDTTSINLTHLLARLESNLLSPSADLKPLRRSPYHRARVGANIEYARSLILKLELSLPNIKIQSHKHALQADLAQRRQQIMALNEQLDAISAAAEADSETQAFLSDNEEDILPTPSDSTPETTSPPPTRGVDRASAEEENAKDEKGAHREEHQQEEESHTAQEPRQVQTLLDQPASQITHPRPPQQPSLPSNTLRSRHHPPLPTIPTATTTGTSLSKPATTTKPTTETTPFPPHDPKTTLSQNEDEQDTLTTSLLSLATQLKTSTQKLHTSLESEKSIIARAAEGLDRSTAGMEAAGKRMGALRRMAEGKGWWGRALMYLWIFGLWVVAVLIVFMGPKLRF
ncbi:uncharacterized protein PADG_07280 [Paracoccidioides brasiliensis Pb18]|uniref:Synaptobrevin n=1 Tax=Paracoccidioides brasiliensis (strain Pb18) TaxID=502780 RepID=C1GJ44_PARBD|nr:uncharacterized protein PADG_07280 [Paracoccidioides brasiliensis Pb18]EEH42460.1 hypothetical protein PADG_07280 [Paracoccidioides brasiliensis Pb18]ODH46246.1 hypothetical protein GX48_07669 [Paracoccidioides brasiliensis]